MNLFNFDELIKNYGEKVTANDALLANKKEYKHCYEFAWPKFARGAVYYLDTFDDAENNFLSENFAAQTDEELKASVDKLTNLLLEGISLAAKHSNRDRYLLIADILKTFCYWLTDRLPKKYERRFETHKKNRLGNLMWFTFTLKNKETYALKKIHLELWDFNDLMFKINDFFTYLLTHTAFTLPLTQNDLTGYNENVVAIIKTILAPDWYEHGKDGASVEDVVEKFDDEDESDDEYAEDVEE